MKRISGIAGAFVGALALPASRRVDTTASSARPATVICTSTPGLGTASILGGVPEAQGTQCLPDGKAR